MNEENRANLTAEEARKFNETGSVETWTEMDPQPKRTDLYIQTFSPLYMGRFIFAIENTGMAFGDSFTGPHGPDGEVFIAEPWHRFDNAYIYESLKRNYQGLLLRSIKSWKPAETMPQEASRFNAMQTTEVKRRDGVWGFVTTRERIGYAEKG